MAGEVGMGNDVDINIKVGEVFPNGGDEKIVGKGKSLKAQQHILDEVQGILERNRWLLHEIDENHEAREAGGLNYNFTLMGVLHNNMARIINIYSDLYSSFSRSLSKGSPDAVDGTKGGPKEATTTSD